MSLMGMKQGIQKFSVPIMALIGLSMLGSSVYLGLGRNGTSLEARNEALAGTAVAKIGELSVTRRMLDKIVDQQLRQFEMFGMPKPPADALDGYRLGALEMLKSQEAVVVAAKKEGITISDQDLAAGVDKVWAEQGRSVVAKQLSLSEKATDNEIEAALLKQNANLSIEGIKAQMIDPDAVRFRLYNDALRAALQAKKKVDPATVKKSLTRYKVRHILINWDAKTTEAAAKAKAEKLLAEVKADPTKMADLAKKNSDDPGSKDKGGLYEWKKEELSSLVPEFKAAVEKLKAGETNPTVVRHKGGYSGFHVIRLEGIGAPDDFDKEQKKYIDDYTKAEVDKELTKLTEAIAPTLKLELLDPGLRVAQLTQEGMKGNKPNEKLLTEALTELAKIKKEDDPLGIVPLRKATLLEQLKKDAEAAAAYEEALKLNGNKVETRFKLARLLVKLGQKDKVALQLAEAEKLAIPEPEQWAELATLYKQIGDTTNERRALEKNQELTKRKLELQARERAAQQAQQVPSPSGKP